MANFANPTVGSNYTDFPTEIRASVDAALQQLSVGSHTNIPANSIQWDSNDNRWKKYVDLNNDGNFAFEDLTSTYDLNANVSVNQLDLGNNDRARFGGSQELQIYNDGTNSRIQSLDHLFIKGGDITFFKGNSAEQFIDCNSDGSVDLFFNNSKKFSTDDNGIQVTNRVGIGRTAGRPLDVEGSAQIGAADTNDAELIIGRTFVSSTVGRNAYIDLIGDNTYSDYGLRIIRKNAGPDTESDVIHRGIGAFRFINNEAASFQFYSNANPKAIITSQGRLGIGLTNPDVAIHTNDGGSIYALFRGNQNSDGSSAVRQIKLFTTAYRGSIQSLQASGSSFITNDLLLNPDGSDVMVGAADDPDSRFEVRDSSATGIISRSSNTQSTDSNKGLRVRNNSTTDTFSVSYRGAGYFARQILIGNTSAANSGNSIETAAAARFQAPSDFWATASAFYGVQGYGYLGSHGGYETTLVSGGYRKGSSQWQNYTINGVTGNATMIAMGTQSSYIALRLETGKADGSSSVVTDRFRFFPTSSLSIASTTEKTKLYINGGESETGCILVENVLFSANQDKPILIAGTQNYSGATTNWGTYGFQLRFKTNSSGSPRLTVDSEAGEMLCIRNNNFVGIGTNSPDTTLHAHKGSAGSVSSDNNAVITLENNNHCILQMLSPAANSNRIMFGDPSDNNAGEINYDHNINALLIKTNADERVRIDLNGQLGVGTSNIYGKIHANSAANKATFLAEGEVDNPSYPAYGFSGQNADNGSRGTGMYLPGDGQLAFATVGNQQVTIDGSGRLLVNRTSGDFHLDVAGAGRLSGYLYLANAQRVVWGSSNTAFIEGDDDAYLRFGVNNEVGRFSPNRLLVGVTTDITVGQDNVYTGFSVEKNGRIAGSTSSTETGISLNTNATSNSKHYCSFRRAGTQIGSITQNGASNVAFNTSSDRRLKENIIDLKDALTNLLKLQPRRFNFIADETKQTVDGLIAQEVEETGVCVNAVWKDKENKEMMQIDYSKFMTLAIAAIQELAGKVQKLENL